MPDARWVARLGLSVSSDVWSGHERRSKVADQIGAGERSDVPVQEAAFPAHDEMGAVGAGDHVDVRDERVAIPRPHGDDRSPEWCALAPGLVADVNRQAGALGVDGHLPAVVTGADLDG